MDLCGLETVKNSDRQSMAFSTVVSLNRKAIIIVTVPGLHKIFIFLEMVTFQRVIVAAVANLLISAAVTIG